MALTTEEIAGLLKEFGLRTALKGGNPYSAKAYVTAAQNLKSLGAPLGNVIAAGELTRVPGIGNAIAEIITKLYRHGTHPKLEAMRKETPAALLEMLEIPKVRPEDVLKIQKAGITSMAELEDALRKGNLQEKGISTSFQRKLLEGIDIHRQSEGKIHLHRADYLLAEMKASLEERRPDLKQVAIAGELRRCCELVGHLSLVAVGAANRTQALGTGTLHICDAEHYGLTLLFETGSDAHIKALQAFAQKKGFALTRDSFMKGRNQLAARSEDEIYKALGLPFIPPELREGRGELELAAKGNLPKLVEQKDVKGILHAHTEWSDGTTTIAALADACRKKGYDYLGLTDHSQTAHYAGGLTSDEVREQQREIERLNRRKKSFHIFKGIESDILVDGSLDYPDSVLKSFDLVVASIHGQFRKSEKEQTERLLRAIANPHTTVLGHVTGRQLLRRHGYDVDLEKILSACAEHNVAIEVNGHPWRLDIDWRWLQLALEAGCMVSLDPDAHSISEIDNVKWSVAMARKGGVPKERVINCLETDRFADFLGEKKPPSTRPRRSSLKPRGSPTAPAPRDRGGRGNAASERP